MANVMQRIARRFTKRNTSWLCSTKAFEVLVGNGYTQLIDCPEVQMCVDVYADLISSMTLYLMENTENGDVRIRDALSMKVDVNPNKHMTRKSFISHIVRVLMLEGEGNQITMPQFDADGLLENLQPIPPSQVTFRPNGDSYDIYISGKRYAPDEVLHFVIKPDAKEPWRGTGYKAVLKDIVKGLKQATATKHALLESPAPSLIVKVDGLIDEFSSLEGRKKLASQYLDSSENGRPWFIPSEAFSVEQVKPLTMRDMAIRENIELDKKTAAAIFRVPSFLVGVGNYNKDEYNAFINHAIMPMAQALQQELTKKLLYSPTRYWRFNPRSLYSYDISEIINAGGAMVDRAAMTRNEWRDWVGMGPREDMEDIVLLENYLPIDRLGDQKKLTEGEA